MQRVPQEMIVQIRHKFAALHKEIKAFKKPWPPWALVNLLGIDDSSSPIPAEQILYQALQGRKIGGLAVRTDVLQEDFVCQTNSGTLHWRNGDELLGKHRRYFMEHVGSRTKVTAGEMWEFTEHFITSNDLGLIDNYLRPQNVDKQTGKRKISRRFKELLKRTREDMPNILAVHKSVLHMDVSIARELATMGRLRVLDIDTYRDSVAKKKAASKAQNNADKPTLKQVARRRKRQLCRALKQNDRLRSKVR